MEPENDPKHCPYCGKRKRGWRAQDTGLSEQTLCAECEAEHDDPSVKWDYRSEHIIATASNEPRADEIIEALKFYHARAEYIGEQAISDYVKAAEGGLAK